MREVVVLQRQWNAIAHKSASDGMFGGEDGEWREWRERREVCREMCCAVQE
jgi:hypothetical protein